MRINQPHTRECFEDKSTYQLILIPLKLNVRSSFKLSTLSLKSSTTLETGTHRKLEQQSRIHVATQNYKLVKKKKIRAKKEAEIPEVMSDQAMAMS